MLRLTASMAAFLLITPAAAGAQTPAVSNDPHYLLIDAESTRSRIMRTINVSKVRERLRDAADKGFSLLLMSTHSRSLNMLLRRSTTISASQRLVAESSESALIDELNKAAAEGFRVVPKSIKALDETSMGVTQTMWVAVLAKQSDQLRVKYSVVKGKKEAEAALTDSSARGRALVGVLGRQGMAAANIVLFFEEIEETARDAPGLQQAEYRVVSAARTSAMQADLAAAAAEGFRVIAAGSGYMTAVMARERWVTSNPLEYRLFATHRVGTSVKELQAAGAEGFRIVGTSHNVSEGIFIVERLPGTSERFDYEIVQLQEANTSKVLVGAERDGFRILCLLDDLAVLERQRK